MYKYLILSVVLFLSGSHASSQKVHSVVFENLSRTDTAFLENFITVSRGQVLDSTVIEKDRQQLVNLEILSDVQYEVIRQSDGYKVIFVCTEVFPLLPIASFGGISENAWMLVGATHVNLFGKGQKFYGFYQFYDRHSFGATMSFNRVYHTRWGFNLNFIKWGTLEPLYFSAGQVDYAYDNYTYGADVIYNIDLFQKILVGGSYFTESYLARTPLVEGAPPRAKKRKALIKFLYDINRINYHFFYQDGIQNTLNIQSVYSFDQDPLFAIIFNDFKYFKRLGPSGNIAGRIRVGLSSNHNSPFAPFVLDSYLNIRGVGNRVDRGTGTIVTNIEYRQTAFDHKNIAIQAIAFSDLGTWRQPGGGFDDFIEANNIVWFAGIGTRLIHKKIFNAILRIDYGINVNNWPARGFVVGVGQYF